jgi:hypothetical protein
MGDAPQACQDQCELGANAGNERTLMARARVESRLQRRQAASVLQAPGFRSDVTVFRLNARARA